MRKKNVISYIVVGVSVVFVLTLIFGQTPTHSNTASNNIVISQIYPGATGIGENYRKYAINGRLDSGLYIYDYVELFNRGITPINLSGYSIQIGTEVGNVWVGYSFPNNTIIEAGRYLLIQCGSGGGGGIVLPTGPDLSSDCNGGIPAGSGKAALVASTAGLSCGSIATPCNLSNSLIADWVSYGTGSDGEGESGAKGSTVTNNEAVVRLAQGCLDTNSNVSDFVAVTTPLPHNSLSQLTDCNVLPKLSINSINIVEGDNSLVNATFTVTTTNTATQPITVTYTTTDNTATNSDYIATSGIVTFSVGETSKFFTVAVKGDTTFEVNETFTVSLSAPINAMIAITNGIGTIINDDLLPAISINTSTIINEGNAGTNNAIFTITLNYDSAVNTTLTFATTEITALSGSDFISATGQLTFLAGEITKTLIILINGDTLLEPNEDFAVTLSNPINATITLGSGRATIQNDDIAATNNPVTTTVSTNGATISITRDIAGAAPTTTLILSANTFTDPVNIVVDPEPNGNFTLGNGSKEIYRYEAHAEYVSNRNEAHINGNYNICIFYRDADIVGLVETDIKIYYLKTPPNGWEVESSSIVYPDENKVCASPNHFSIWGLFAPPPTQPRSGSPSTPIPQPTLPPNEDEADLSIIDSLMPISPAEGESAVLTLTVRLKGERNGTSAMIVNDLPSGLMFKSVHVIDSTGTCEYIANGNRIECVNLLVTQLQPVVININAIASHQGIFTNVARVIGLDTRIIDLPSDNETRRNIAIRAQAASIPPTTTPIPNNMTRILIPFIQLTR